jgi:hypothetical protein
MNAAEARVLKTIKQVYGEFGKSFPKPLGQFEAGLGSDGMQRRYLWTDAFGIFALIAISKSVPEALPAARQLVIATETCLGQPRSPKHKMRKTDNDKFVGLRIGKLQENVNGTSDAGMELDGMYWHYLDKWMFALLRLGQTCNDVSFILRAAIGKRNV